MVQPAGNEPQMRGDRGARVTDTGREAKFYRRTKQGLAQLQSGTASWDRLAEAIGQILRTEGGRP